MLKKILFLFLSCFISLALVSCDISDYIKAMSLIEEGKYEDAKKLLESIKDYYDAEYILNDFYYVPKKFIATEDDYVMTGEYTYVDNYLSKYYEVEDDWTWRVDFQLDTNKNLALEISTYTDGTYINSYEYNSQNKVLKEISTDPYGGQSSRVYTYDIKGNLIKEVCTFSSGKRIYDYTYNADGNLIKQVETDSDNSYKTVYDYTYDTNGNLIKIVVSNSDSDKCVYDGIYDENNNLIYCKITDYYGNFATLQATYTLVYIKGGMPEWMQYYCEKYTNISNII